MAQDLSHARSHGLIPEEALRRVPGWSAGGTPASVEVLDGGTVNASFLVGTPAGRFVVRLHGEDAETLGSDHDREVLLQSAAAQAGLAPEVVYADPERHFLISRYAQGAVWSRQDLGRRDRLMHLGSRLRALHGIAVPSIAPFDLRAVLHRYAERIMESDPADASAIARLLDRSELALRACRSTTRVPAIVHNDLHHTNLVGCDPLQLIDWEYAAVADPLFDLACLLAYYPHAYAFSGELLQASGLADQASPDMLREATWLFVLVSYFWYRMRRLTALPEAREVTAEQALLRRLQR